MAGLRTRSIVLALGLAALVAPAFGQTVSRALVASQPAISKSAISKSDVKPAAASVRDKAPAATPRLINSWICASGMRLEIYPVSFDEPTATTEYVVVYKQNGDVVASERIDARIAKQFPAYGCNDSDMRDRSDLLG